MYVSRRIRSLSIALTAGGLPLLLTLSLHSQPVHSQPVPETPRQVADALDKIVQPRFQDVTAGFGLTRLVPVVPGHQSVGFYGSFRTNTPAEATLLAAADAPHRPYVMAFLHCAHVPGEAARKTPQTVPSAAPSDMRRSFRTIAVSGTHDGYPVGYLERTEPVLRQAALSSLPAAMKGRSVQTRCGDWTLFLRPVAASKETCLTCHTGAKRGGTLGVMVYAVDKAVIHAPIHSFDEGDL